MAVFENMEEHLMVDNGRNAEIIKQTLAGKTMNEIGAAIGLHPTTVYRRKKKLRAFIEEQAIELLNRGLTVARKGTLRASAEVLKQYKAKDKKEEYDKDLINLGLAANKTIFQAGGILSQGGNTINNIIQINAVNEVPEVIANVLKQLRMADTSQGNLLDDGSDVIDIQT